MDSKYFGSLFSVQSSAGHSSNGDWVTKSLHDVSLHSTPLKCVRLFRENAEKDGYAHRSLEQSAIQRSRSRETGFSVEKEQAENTGIVGEFCAFSSFSVSFGRRAFSLRVLRPRKTSCFTVAPKVIATGVSLISRIPDLATERHFSFEL